MKGGLTLTGYRYSVYTRAVRMALALKGVEHVSRECDPFDQEQADVLRRLHPFGRVPVLEHGGFHLWETQAILDYVDAGFPGPALTPKTAKAKARMRQVMSIADSYTYWPLVRQVFSEGIWAERFGDGRDQNAFDAGLSAAPRVLDALDRIADEGLVLTYPPTLADCHLWQMIDCFCMVPEGAELIDKRPAFACWGKQMRTNPAALSTFPDLETSVPGGDA